jgi:hypothetical protein
VPNREDKRRSDGEQGQALLLLVVAMTIAFVAGAIAIDVGLWLSERRGAQTDADLPALAGAWELLDPIGNNQAAAAGAVNDWISGNDEQGNLTLHNVTVDDSCFDQGTLDAVTVNVRHDSVALFSRIFNVAEPDIGAHAKACAGAAQGVIGVVPFQVNDDNSACFDSQEEPLFGTLCPIAIASQGGGPAAMLDLEAAGGRCSDAQAPPNFEELIESGSLGNCLMNTQGNCNPGSSGPWDDCVGVQSASNQEIVDGLKQRLHRTAICDLDGDGLDELNESVSAVFGAGAGALYEARDCDPGTNGTQVSPRLVNIVVLDDRPSPGSNGYPIKAFAAFFLAGCTSPGTSVNSPRDVDRDCDRPGHDDDDDDDNYFGRVWGEFVNLVVTGVDVGAPASPTTIFGISLEE